MKLARDEDRRIANAGLARLADSLVDDLMAMTDEEILLESFMDGEDAAEIADRMRGEIDQAIGRTPP